jgi:hypothetical protein
MRRRARLAGPPASTPYSSSSSSVVGTKKGSTWKGGWQQQWGAAAQHSSAQACLSRTVEMLESETYVRAWISVSIAIDKPYHPPPPASTQLALPSPPKTPICSPQVSPNVTAAERRWLLHCCAASSHPPGQRRPPQAGRHGLGTTHCPHAAPPVCVCGGGG